MKKEKRKTEAQREDRKEIPWAELEKRSRIGWIALSVILAVSIVMICILQGATGKQPLEDGKTELSVLHLEDTYAEIAESPEIYSAATPDAIRAEEPWKKPVLIIDAKEQYFCSVYERKESGALLPIGNYPVIEQERAQQQLGEGRYFTNVPGDFPGEDAVVSGELLYRNDGSRIVIPYYRFMIALTEPEEGETPDQEKQYGAFYVPAVEGEYLDNLSIWHETE